MTEIRAFVGHSFAIDDEAVVTAFSKYFDSLSKSKLNFSWTHAEPAEPRALADKVTALLRDCNLFIAICTKKERVIAPTALSATLWPRGYLKGSNRDFAWKASDWVIQEIGLAVGKGLNLILLLESGVQNPGGLQGDIEYVLFNRENPAGAFQKIFEMICAISPRIIGVPAVPSTETRSPPAEARGDEAAPSTDENWWMPEPGWSHRQYQIALFYMTDTGDEAKAKMIYEAYLKSEHAAQDDNRQSWEAYGEYARLRFGRGGSLSKLKALAAAHPESPGTLEQLAKGLAQYDHSEAASAYDAAAQKAGDNERGLRLMGEAAAEYARGGAQTKASEVIAQMKSKSTAIRGGERWLIRALRQVAEIEKDEDVMIAVMERAVEVAPDDDETRFELAYKHSEKGHNDLALFHYLKIRMPKRHASTWNNIGVAFEQAGLSARAVNAYRESEKLEGTLAMSNLAQKLMSAGFLSEAKQQCEKGLKVENFHQNVASTLAELRSVPEEEERKETELLGSAQPLSEFYKQLGRAILRPEPASIAAHWMGKNCELSARLVGREFEATGSYEQSRGLLGSLSAFGNAGQDTPDRYHEKYEGAFRGYSITGFMSRTLEEDATKVRGLLSSAEYKIEVVMVLAGDGNEIRVMEKPEKGSPRFYTLTKLG
jgi:tetratricopeptide (TPR) repeat protein